MRVTRFVIGATIEERILKLQEKKQLVFDGTVGGDVEALGRLTEDDLRFLVGEGSVGWVVGGWVGWGWLQLMGLVCFHRRQAVSAH